MDRNAARQRALMGGRLLAAVLAAATIAHDAFAQTPPESQPRRWASGFLEGHLSPLVCGEPTQPCSAGTQLDAVVAGMGHRRDARTRNGELMGVFALKGGFVVTGRLFDANWQQVPWYVGRGWDSCRVELVDVAIAITDHLIQRVDLEAIYLLKMRTKTLDLTPDQRSRSVSRIRYATVAVRVDIHCLIPDRQYPVQLKALGSKVLIEKYAPGLSSVVILN